MLPPNRAIGTATNQWPSTQGRHASHATGSSSRLSTASEPSLSRRDRKVRAALIAAGFSCPAGRTKLRLDEGYWFANLRVGDKIVIITGENPATDEATLAQLRLRYGIVAVQITPLVLREARSNPGSLSLLIETAMAEQAELQAGRAARRTVRHNRRARSKAVQEPTRLTRAAEAAIGQLPGLTSSRLATGLAHT